MANKRIIELLKGEEEGLQLWNPVNSLSDLEIGDYIRIFEDKDAKSKGITLIEGYIKSKPWNHDADNITSFDIETKEEAEANKEKQEKEELKYVSSLDPYAKDLTDDDYKLLLKQCQKDIKFLKHLLQG